MWRSGPRCRRALPNLPLDLIEALTYGREWQLGYDKLPPLPWWLVEITYRLFGPDLFYYLLAQLTVVAAFALVWAMARPLVGAVGALVAILIIDGLHYLLRPVKRVVQRVLGTVGFAYWAAPHGRPVMDCAEARHRIRWAIFRRGAGAANGAVLCSTATRRTLATPALIAVAVALVVMAPHLIWLVQNHFSFAMPKARAALHGALDYLYKPPRFLLYRRASWCRRC
jgi:hypothetical protein